MRILHVVTLVDDEGSYGGALTVAVHQCIELRRRGHDARITGGWRGRGPAPAEVEGVPVHLFRVRPIAPGLGFSGLFSPALLQWVRRHGASFDIAHLHLTRDLVPLSIAGQLQRLGLPYVVQTHGALRPGTRPLARLLDRRMTRRALLSARHVFAGTIEERDAITRISGTADGISLLPGGVVLPDRVPVRTGDGPADVLFLGRLQPNRRVMAFAAAADRLVADGLGATFSVVGPDGGDLRQLRRFIAARPRLAGRLNYEGTLPHDHAVCRLRRADLYVLPSVDGQAYPISLLEAMAAGVPSIVTTECSLAGTLAREHAALVANPTDDALYGAMRRMLTDRAARAQVAVRAAATAASVFSMTPVAEVLEDEYGATASANGLPPGRGRRRLLWVVTAPTQAHAQVWDAVRAGARLTVVLLDPPAGAERKDGGEPVATAALTGRGYQVHQVSASGGHAPAAVQDLLRDRPDALILDGGSARARGTMRRWAERAGVHVVLASDQAGPGAVARAALSAVSPGGGDVDLRDPPAASGTGTYHVIDLQPRPRAPGHRQP
jgi:glycosyltransferase involved in cell wall biosynthesis